MSLFRMAGQLVSTIESIRAGTAAARHMVIVDTLGREVSFVVASQVSSAIEDSWTEVAGVTDGCGSVFGEAWCCIGEGDNLCRSEAGRM
jgi:hypothetical protein